VPQEGEPTIARGRWTLATIRCAFDWLSDYSLSGVQRLLSGFDLHLRSARVQQYSPDPEYAAKEQHLLSCLRAVAQEPEALALVFVDQMGYYRWPAPAPDWSAGAPALAPMARRAGPNNQQWRTVGAMNARTGQVHYQDGYIVGRQQMAAFYRQLDAHYGGAGVDRLFVVQDNWSIHRHPDVLWALEGLPRLEVVWLPTYAPWLNPIEKLWRWLRQDVLKMHRLAQEFAGLKQRVRAFLDQFAHGSPDLLRYVGLLGQGKLAQALVG
jgi:transposase